MIASATRDDQEAFLASLSRAEVQALPYLFEFWALPHQVAPEGDWRTWAILGGRGAGKTRAGAEWVRSEVEGPMPDDPGRSSRVALIAETFDQARDVMVFGESGILACSPPDRKPRWEASKRRLVWPNGAVAQVFSASDFEGLRGPQFDAAWCDDLERCKSMSETARLNLPLVQPAQAQKHVTVNEAFARLDALTQISLTAIDTTTPPVSPAEGDLYGIGVGSTGDWTSQDGRLGLFLNGGWLFVQPAVGWRGSLVTTGSVVTFDGVTWVEGGGAFSAHGAGFVHRSIEVDHSVGTGSTSDVPAFLPANTLVYGVTGRVLADIGGPTSLEIGVSGSSNRYGSGIGVSTGAWARGLTGSPLAYYSDTDLVLTATGGNFDGSGTFRLAVHFAELTLPRA